MIRSGGQAGERHLLRGGLSDARRSALALFLGIALLLLCSPPGAADALEGPTPQVMDDPATQQQIADARQQASEDASQRHPPSEASERAQADYAYSEITDAEAVQLTAQTFAGLLDQRVWQPDLPEGAAIVDYLGTHAALVEPAGSDLQLTPPQWRSHRQPARAR